MIEVENLSKTYRAVPLNPLRKPTMTRALELVTFRVDRGEVCSIVGRNGAGKTTLLKILATLVLPDGGRADVCGHNVVGQAAAVRRKIGIVTGDERSFYWRLSGRENLILFGALHNIPKRELYGRVRDIMDSLELTVAADLPFRSYSSGMKQRLAIARCLIHDPEVLLMDEPNKGIDPLLQSVTIDYVRDDLAGRKRKTILFATHNLDEAAALGGKIAILDGGGLMYFGGFPGGGKVRELMCAGADKENRRPGDSDLK